jgi:uncharacterized protein YbaR (Trm112 family)
LALPIVKILKIGDTMNWIEKYLSILQCPYCKGDLYLDRDKNKLICKKCNRVYDIINGIPILLRY